YLILSTLLLLQYSGARRALHSFPTRRSSDLRCRAIRNGDMEASRELPQDAGRRGKTGVVGVREEEDGLREVRSVARTCFPRFRQDRKSTRLNSSHVKISYAVFCLKKKNEQNI